MDSPHKRAINIYLIYTVYGACHEISQYLEISRLGDKDIYVTFAWWRHQMETFSALLAICAGNSPVSGEFPAQRPVTRSFDIFFDVRLIKRLSKHSRGWWFETLSHPLWRHRNGINHLHVWQISQRYRKSELIAIGRKLPHNSVIAILGKFSENLVKNVCNIVFAATKCVIEILNQDLAVSNCHKSCICSQIRASIH